MSRRQCIADRFKRPLTGLAVAVLLLGGVPRSVLAADRAETPPTLAVSAYEPLPDALRKPVPESVEELRAIEERVRSLIGDLRAVTVGLSRGPAQGTGVIVSNDGYVLTAAHVSGPPGRPVTIIRNNGDRLQGVSLGRDTTTDAGLVKITSSGTWPVAKIGDMDHLKQGDWVIGTGHPGGFDSDRLPVIRLGRVIASMSRLLHTDVTLVGGDSGGPLFDLTGRVIGIHSRIGPGAELNFHVPISVYSDNWYWMIHSEDRPIKPEPGGPMLGVDGDRVRGGCRVTRVSSNTPAEAAGLAKGDVIVRLDDRYIRSLDDLVAAVNHHSPGQTVLITYRRGGETLTAKVTLAERPRRTERPPSSD
ncbi:MAG: PDZ domain-containing protein [Planctomycetaceae bacterium]|nr:PDZ domain-containing protein [Planctomycetaceae bacterium]